jgi:hypothetical protein
MRCGRTDTCGYFVWYGSLSSGTSYFFIAAHNGGAAIILFYYDMFYFARSYVL